MVNRLITCYNFQNVVTELEHILIEENFPVRILDSELIASSMGCVSYIDEHGAINGELVIFPYNLEKLLFILGINLSENFKPSKKEIKISVEPKMFFKEYIF